jgi:hypothetical protein
MATPFKVSSPAKRSARKDKDTSRLLVDVLARAHRLGLLARLVQLLAQSLDVVLQLGDALLIFDAARSALDRSGPVVEAFKAPA